MVTTSCAESDSASLASMMASLGGGVEVLELGDSYDADSFDEESEEEEEEEDRALSETGTYVLDKEEEEKQKVRMIRRGIFWRRLVSRRWR